MNWLLNVVLIFLLLSAIYGMRRGLVRTVFPLVEVVVLVIIIGLMVTNFLAFLGIFIAAVIVLYFLFKALKIFSRLPIVHSADKLLGFFAGFVLGLVLVWIFFWIVSLFAATGFGSTMLTLIYGSDVLTWLYQNNGVLSFASEHFAWYT